MSWANNQPVLLSPWGQGVGTNGHSSAFTSTMRGWSGAQNTTSEALHHPSRAPATYSMPQVDQK